MSWMVTGSLCPASSTEMRDRQVLELAEDPLGERWLMVTWFPGPTRVISKLLTPGQSAAKPSCTD